MQSVADRWYVVYRRVSLLIGLLFATASAIALFLPQFIGSAAAFGLNNYVILGIALVQVCYILVLARTVSRRYGLPASTMLIALLNLLGVLGLLQSTGGASSWYEILWVLLIISSGMFGTYALVAASFMITAFSVVSVSSTHADISYGAGLGYLAQFVGTILVAVISHYLWRHAYVNQETVRVAQLSGMLQNKQQQSEILIQSLADGIIVTNPEGQINLINPMAAQMTEWPTEEAVGIDVKLVAKLNREDGTAITEEENPFIAAFTSKTSVNERLRLIGKNNKETIVSIVASPIMLDGGKTVGGVVAVLRDVSAGYKEERQRADFISTASHEMRTPVAAIEGYLALALNERVSKIDPKARSYLEKAHESTQHLGQLFQDLLTSAKAEDGRLVSHPKVVEMGSYLEQLTDSLRFAAQKKGLLTEFLFGTNDVEQNDLMKTGHVIKPLYYVHVDPDRLREVITNLFDNAVKYTPGGKITVGLTGNEQVVQLFVRDTGHGIPKEDVPHLFQKFYRVDNSDTRTIGGTGLGLFICRKIIELYHGHIWVESQAGRGSTFYINLPRLTAARAEVLQREEMQGQPAPITSLASPVL